MRVHELDCIVCMYVYVLYMLGYMHEYVYVYSVCTCTGICSCELCVWLRGTTMQTHSCDPNR